MSTIHVSGRSEESRSGPPSVGDASGRRIGDPDPRPESVPALSLPSAEGGNATPAGATRSFAQAKLPAIADVNGLREKLTTRPHQVRSPIATLTGAPNILIHRMLQVPRRGMSYFEGVDLNTSTPVFIKVMPLSDKTSAGSALMFANEISMYTKYAELTGRLPVPRSCGVTEFSRTGGSVGPIEALFLVLEQYSSNLRTLGTFSYLSFTQRVDLVEAAMKCVADLHVKHGVVHRDIKPENFLLYKGCGRVTLCDMETAGMGPHLRDLDKIFRDRNERGSMGTEAYMAPEQFAQHFTEHGLEVDVFALALVMHEMLTGMHPRESFFDPVPLRSRCVVTDPKNYPLAASPKLPGPLRAVFRKATEFDPADRYLNAGELLRDFRRAVKGEAIEARDHLEGVEWVKYLASRTWKWIKSDTVGKGVVGSLGLIAGLVIGFGIPSRNNSPPSPFSKPLPNGDLKEGKEKGAPRIPAAPLQ